MRLDIKLLALFFLAAQAQFSIDIPQIHDITLPVWLWKFFYMLINFDDTGSSSYVTNPTKVYQGLDGTYAIDENSFLWKHGYATAEDKDYTWFEHEGLSGVAINDFVPSISPSLYLYLVGTVPYISLNGADLELSIPSGTTSCLNAITTNIIFTMVGIDCTDAVVTIDLDDLASGWVAFANQPTGTPVKISYDTFDTAYIVTDADEIEVGTDATAWVSLATPDNFPCYDVSANFEGTIWLACDDSEANHKVYQKIPAHEEYVTWNEMKSQTIHGFHVASASTIDEDTGVIWSSDIWGLNKKINKLISDYLDMALAFLPIELPS